MWTRLLKLIASLALVLAACGSDNTSVVEGSDGDDVGSAGSVDEPVDAGSSSTATFETVEFDGEFEVRCGNVPFPNRSIDLTKYAVFTGNLDDFIDENFRAEFDLQWEEGLSEATFYEIERTDDLIWLLGEFADAADFDPRFIEIAFERIDGEWRFSTWGGCRPQVVAEGFGISELRLDPEKEPTEDSTSLSLLVTERECASGQLPGGRSVSPVVIESATTVQILVLIEESRGDVTCQGNPSFPLDIELEAPLGVRQIFDIAMEPAIELVWPIPLAPAN